MRHKTLARATALGALVALALPAVASADTFDRAGNTGLLQSVAINSIWVIVAGCVVMFMQAGFAFLEIGFSRGKNAGTVVAKILVNFSIAGLAYYFVGFALAFGLGHQVLGMDLWGTKGFLLQGIGDPLANFPAMGVSDAT